MRLDSLHPGATHRAVRDTMAGTLARVPGPGHDPGAQAEELRLIREELDPAGDYTR